MTSGIGGRSITVIGAGQAGLMLAIGLRRAGHSVRLVQDRPAAAIADGRVMSGQCMFATARSLERAASLDLWAGRAPAIERIRIETRSPGRGAPCFAFSGRLEAPAESIDQRLKFPAWLRLFEEIGGQTEVRAADVDLIERAARESDLVIVAAGKGPLADLFPLNQRWSPFTQPVRAMSMVYLRSPDTEKGPRCLSSTTLPGAGWIVRFPALTHGGACEILFFEAEIGGALDLGHPDMTADELWDVMRPSLARFLPVEGERLAFARPTDSRAGLVGRLRPVVRHAVGALPSGRRILGLGDVVVINDPLLGQGANSAAKAAALCLDAIHRRGSRPFDDAWLDDLAGAMWKRIRAAAIWTNVNLRAAAQPVVEFFHRATADQAAADWFVRGFDEPNSIMPLLLGQKAAAP